MANNDEDDRNSVSSQDNDSDIEPEVDISEDDDTNYTDSVAGSSISFYYRCGISDIDTSTLDEEEAELVRTLYDKKVSCCKMECTRTIPAEVAVRTREQFLESTKEERDLIMLSIMEVSE